MSEPIPTSVNWSEFTDSQRRRAEALLLVRLLFPMSSAGQARDIAEWITHRRPTS